MAAVPGARVCVVIPETDIRLLFPVSFPQSPLQSVLLVECSRAIRIEHTLGVSFCFKSFSCEVVQRQRRLWSQGKGDRTGLQPITIGWMMLPPKQNLFQ